MKGGGGVATPVTPSPPLPLDLPMMHTNLSRKVLFFLNLFSKCNGDYPLSAIDAKNSSHGKEQILCTNLTYVLLNCGYFLVLVHFNLKVYSYVYKLTYSLTYLLVIYWVSGGGGGFKHCIVSRWDLWNSGRFFCVLDPVLPLLLLLLYNSVRISCVRCCFQLMVQFSCCRFFRLNSSK